MKAWMPDSEKSAWHWPEILLWPQHEVESDQSKPFVNVETNSAQPIASFLKRNMVEAIKHS